MWQHVSSGGLHATHNRGRLWRACIEGRQLRIGVPTRPGSIGVALEGARQISDRHLPQASMVAGPCTQISNGPRFWQAQGFGPANRGILLERVKGCMADSESPVSVTPAVQGLRQRRRLAPSRTVPSAPGLSRAAVLQRAGPPNPH
jgi:hypothetical protein